MANSLTFSPLISANTTDKPGLISGNYIIRKSNWISEAGKSSKNVASFDALRVKATGKAPATKPNSILCGDCDGNGCKQCPQCEGAGVNSVDHFNGQYKAGAMCWLCRGKKQILCGNCNGAGFLGGFMSTYDE